MNSFLFSEKCQISESQKPEEPTNMALCTKVQMTKPLILIVLIKFHFYQLQNQTISDSVN